MFVLSCSACFVLFVCLCKGVKDRFVIVPLKLPLSALSAICCNISLIVVEKMFHRSGFEIQCEMNKSNTHVFICHICFVYIHFNVFNSFSKWKHSLNQYSKSFSAFPAANKYHYFQRLSVSYTSFLYHCHQGPKANWPSTDRNSLAILIMF